jgi:hypothetical protein
MTDDHPKPNPSLARMNALIDRAWLDRGGPDVRFDEFLNVSEIDQGKLKDWISPLIDKDRARARKPDASAQLGLLLGCICANAIVAMEAAGHGARIQYSRGKTTYVGSTIYKPDFLKSKQFIATIDGMVAAGLLVGHTGDRGSGGREQKRSSYWPTQSLLDGLAERGIAAPQVFIGGVPPVVLLYGEDGALQNYDPTANEVVDKIANLRAYNAFISGQELRLTAPAIGGTTINFAATTLRRQFDGSFDHHGRFYGGWWQNVPEAQRSKITINGAATVELDYASFVPRALYHQEGLTFTDDAYAIPEIMAAAQGDCMDWETVRPVVKKVFNFMLNSKKRGGHMGSKAFEGLPPSITRAEAIAAIERAHEPIKHHFFKQEYFVLQKLDSDICEAVMMAGVDAGSPVLPIHDSFIVEVSKAEWLRSEMTKAYRDKLGFDPVIDVPLL